MHFGITKLGKTKRTIVLSRTKFEGQDWRRGSRIFKNMRQQREKLFRQKEKNSMPIKKNWKKRHVNLDILPRVKTTSLGPDANLE